MLDAEKTSRSLKEELEFVSLYLHLEKLRFGEKLDYCIDVDENVDQTIQLPIMAIHTYAENAIKHGIMSAKGNGRVVIKVCNENKGVKIEVTDDGIGREAANKKLYNIFMT